MKPKLFEMRGLSPWPSRPGNHPAAGPEYERHWDYYTYSPMRWNDDNSQCKLHYNCHFRHTLCCQTRLDDEWKPMKTIIQITRFTVTSIILIVNMIDRIGWELCFAQKETIVNARHVCVLLEDRVSEIHSELKSTPHLLELKPADWPHTGEYKQSGRE